MEEEQGYHKTKEMQRHVIPMPRLCSRNSHFQVKTPTNRFPWWQDRGRIHRFLAFSLALVSNCLQCTVVLRTFTCCFHHTARTKQRAYHCAFWFPHINCHHFAQFCIVGRFVSVLQRVATKHCILQDVDPCVQHKGQHAFCVISATT